MIISGLKIKFTSTRTVKQTNPLTSRQYAFEYRSCGTADALSSPDQCRLSFPWQHDVAAPTKEAVPAWTRALVEKHQKPYIKKLAYMRRKACTP